MAARASYVSGMTSRIRRATIDDIAIIAHHRVSMFLDMGSADPADADELRSVTEEFLRDAIPHGEYIGWLACADDDPSKIIAGAGVQIRRVLPFPRAPRHDRSSVAHGRQALVLNVYTEPPYRRRGMARHLMDEILQWARNAKVDSLVLHAARDGRPLYEQLSFKQTNEMRYMGDL